MKTILVTGGAGFIGSHLCERLLEDGNRILCLDNLSTGSRENIAHLEGSKQFVFIAHDIVEPFYLQASERRASRFALPSERSKYVGNAPYTDEKINQIYNLACPASPIHYQANSVRTIKINTIGVINMLGLARTHGARILQASTSEVYGDPLVHPQTEAYFGNVNPFGPRSCYDEGKRCAEALFYDYKHIHPEMEIKVARIFNTYGPHMAFDDGRVVSNFIVQALRGESLTMYGNGKQTRSFCYVDDLVIGLVKLMNSDAEVVGPVNLGNPAEFTVENLAWDILDMVVPGGRGSAPKPVYKEMLQDDPKRRQPDISKAKTQLGWEPTISFESGLQKTIEYFRPTVQ